MRNHPVRVGRRMRVLNLTPRSLSKTSTSALLRRASDRLTPILVLLHTHYLRNRFRTVTFIDAIVNTL